MVKERTCPHFHLTPQTAAHSATNMKAAFSLLTNTFLHNTRFLERWYRRRVCTLYMLVLPTHMIRTTGCGCASSNCDLYANVCGQCSTDELEWNCLCSSCLSNSVGVGVKLEDCNCRESDHTIVRVIHLKFHCYMHSKAKGVKAVLSFLWWDCQIEQISPVLDTLYSEQLFCVWIE